MSTSLIALAILREMVAQRDVQWILDEHSRESELDSAAFALAYSMGFLKDIYTSNNVEIFQFPVNIPLTLNYDPWARDYARSIVEIAMRKSDDPDFEEEMNYPDGRADDALLIHMTALITTVNEIAKNSANSQDDVLETLHKGMIRELA